MINQQFSESDSPYQHNSALSFLPKSFQSPEPPSNPFKTPKKTKSLDDKCRQKHLLKDENVNSSYFLRSNILELTDFNPLIRARIRCWVTEQMAKRNITRETCALTNTLMDLFFSKKGKVSLDHLQELGIACMTIATKLKESEMRKPQVCQNTFSKDKIHELQIEVMMKLQFKLRPQTHVEIGQHILGSWNRYLKRKIQIQPESSFLGNLSFYEPQNQEPIIAFRKLNLFYQILDLGLMNISMLDYDLQDYVMCVFYFLTYKFLQRSCESRDCFCKTEYEKLIKDFTNSLLSDQDFKLGCVLYDSILVKHIENIYMLVMKENQDHLIVKNFEGLTKSTKIFNYYSGIQIYCPYYFKVAKLVNQKINIGKS